MARWSVAFLLSLGLSARAVADASLPAGDKTRVALSPWATRCARHFEQALREMAAVSELLRDVRVVTEVRPYDVQPPRYQVDFVGIELADGDGRVKLFGYAAKGRRTTLWTSVPGTWRDRGRSRWPGPPSIRTRIGRRSEEPNQLDRTPQLHLSRESQLQAELYVDRAPSSVVAQFAKSFQAAIERCEVPAEGDVQPPPPPSPLD